MCSTPQSGDILKSRGMSHPFHVTLPGRMTHLTPLPPSYSSDYSSDIERFMDHTLHTTHYAPHTTLCTLYTTHHTLHTTHYTLHTAHYTLNTTHYTLRTAHCTLHTTHYTLHFSLHTAHHTLHAAHYTLRRACTLTRCTRARCTHTLHDVRCTLHTARCAAQLDMNLIMSLDLDGNGVDKCEYIVGMCAFSLMCTVNTVLCVDATDPDHSQMMSPPLSF